MKRPRLVFDLLTAGNTLRRRIRRDASGLSAGSAGVLLHLAAREDANLSEIAAALSASASATTGLVQRLEGDGLVVRVADPVDARAVRIRLTEAGRVVASALTFELRRLNRRLTDGFSDAELQVVVRWLAHVRALE